MIGNLGSIEYQDILEIDLCMIISSLSIYVWKNALQIVKLIQGGYRMSRVSLEMNIARIIMARERIVQYMPRDNQE